MEIVHSNRLKVIDGIRITSRDSEILLNLEDVSRKLGFTTVATSGNETVRWSRVMGYLEEFDVKLSGSPSETMISESILYLLAMKARNKVAKDFQIKVATEIIPNYRRGMVPQTFSESLQLAADLQKEIEIKDRQLDLKEREIGLEREKRKIQQVLAEREWEKIDREDLYNYRRR